MADHDLNRWMRGVESEEPPELWTDISHRTPRRRPPRQVPKAVRYAGVALISVLIAAGIILPLRAMLPLADRDKGTRPEGASDATATPDGTPQVGVISCNGDTPMVDTPTIQTQTDGVHLSIPGHAQKMPVRLFPQPGTPGTPGQSWAEDGPDTYILDIPPGDYLAICDPNGDTSATQVANGTVTSAAVTIIDPQGFFAPFAETSCPGTKPYLSTAWTLYPDLNPMTSADQVLRRAFTGLEPTDVVVHAGYNPDPAYGGWHQSFWQVLRDGKAVATISLLVPGNDATGSVLQATDVCADSGIGSPADIPTRPVDHALGTTGNPDAPFATPYEIPGYGHCSPYEGADCIPVWMSWARLASLSSQEVVQSNFPRNNGNLPWCPSDSSSGCTVNPNDQPKVVFMPVSDAQRWFQMEGCGQTYDAMCRS